MTVPILSSLGPKTPADLEHSVVSLIRDVDVDGRIIPRGTSGTVVHVYADEIGVEVEFDHPFQAVVTLETSDLAP